MILEIPKWKKEPLERNGSLSFLERLDRAQARARIRCEKKPKQISSDRPSIADIFELWASALPQDVPGHLRSITRKDAIILQQCLIRVARLGDKVAPYLEWCLANWDLVMSVSFKWMKNRPDFPNVAVLVRFSDIFQGAYAQRKRLEAESRMTIRERFVLKLTKQGLPKEEAERQAAEKFDPKPKILQQFQKRDEMAERVRMMKKAKGTPRKTLFPLPVVSEKKGTFEPWRD